MQPGLLSVVIPVYNGAPYLRQAIDSVLAQTYPHVEIVAVNDGSTDESAAILDGYGDAVRVVHQENCGNVGQVRNTGIENASGEFIAFLDQDDWWLPEKLERQLAVMQSDSRIALVHTAVTHFDAATGNTICPLNPHARPERMTGECFEELLMGNALYNSSVLVRRSALDDVGHCDESIAGNTVQDYDLWLRIAKKFWFGFVDEEVTAYRIHAGQGLWNRQAMLSEELNLLLRVRDNAVWSSTKSGRNRMGKLYDAMAVACLDKGDATLARCYFREATFACPSIRQFARLGASLLPITFVNRIRESSMALRSRKRRGTC